jgi:FMN phosphatase YigB (HAD superfamily)
MDRPAVLLALTGTLLDERGEDRALDAAMRRVTSRFEVDLSPRELSGRFRLGLMEAMQLEPALGEPAEFVPYPEAVRGVFAALMAEMDVVVSPQEEEWFVEEYRGARRRHAQLFPDARRAVLRMGKDGHRLGVVTDADAVFLEDSLQGSRLLDVLEVRATAAEVGHVKPHPAVFSLALDRLGVEAEEAVMVGSSYERDLVGAREAGIRRVVLVDRHDARTVDVPRVKSMRGAAREVARWEKRATKWD